jgi:hypothetical protein
MDLELEVYASRPGPCGLVTEHTMKYSDWVETSVAASSRSLNAGP